MQPIEPEMWFDGLFGDTANPVKGFKSVNKMRVLVLHSYYRQSGGEESSIETDLKLMDYLGIDYNLFTEQNPQTSGGFPLKLALDTVWSKKAAARLRSHLSRNSYDLAHVHNTFPMLSGSVYHILKEFRIPVLHTLHNFRMFCTNGILFRHGHPCEECVVHKVPIHSFRESCYYRGAAANAVVAFEIGIHRILRTYERNVDTFLALSQFARNLFVRAGLPADQILVRPNCITPDPGEGDGGGGYGLFVGRLSENKGIMQLLAAWPLAATGSDLRIIGDGPLREAVEAAASRTPGVNYLGPQTRSVVLSQMKGARALVFPSISYEGMPMTILEAFAVGTPVVAHRLGTMAEMISPGVTGWLTDEASELSLARTIRGALLSDCSALDLRRCCRAEYERNYSGTAGAASLRAAYDHALRSVDPQRGG